MKKLFVLFKPVLHSFRNPKLRLCALLALVGLAALIAVLGHRFHHDVLSVFSKRLNQPRDGDLKTILVMTTDEKILAEHLTLTINAKPYFQNEYGQFGGIVEDVGATFIVYEHNPSHIIYTGRLTSEPLQRVFLEPRYLKLIGNPRAALPSQYALVVGAKTLMPDAQNRVRIDHSYCGEDFEIVCRHCDRPLAKGVLEHKAVAQRCEIPVSTIRFLAPEGGKRTWPMVRFRIAGESKARSGQLNQTYFPEGSVCGGLLEVGDSSNGWHLVEWRHDEAINLDNLPDDHLEQGQLGSH